MRRILTAFVTLLAVGLFALAQAETLPRDTREKIIKSTVMLLPTKADGKLDGSLGSGTIISPLGYILTNYHVVGDNDSRTLSEWIQVRTVRFVDKEPEPTYWGKVVAADPNLDLAIVKIAEDKDEKPVSNLNLPFVELGDSNSLIIGDPIFVFGFQGTGGMTLSFSQGSVGGFTGEDLESSGKQWVKHDAQTGPGNSGGGVYDDQGLLVGVHSAGVAGDHNSRTSFFRPLSLAWGLITPNVPKFAVRGAGSPGGQTAGTNTGTSTGNSGKTSGTSTTGNTGSTPNWPPKLAVGQNWTLTFKGTNLAETWSVALTDKDSQGDPKGTASSGNQKKTAFMYYDAKNDRVWIDLTKDGNSLTSCAFDPSSIKTAVWAGRAYSFKDPNADGERIGDCTATLKAQGNAGQSGNTGNSTNTGNTGTAAGSLKWPMNPQVGQTWSFTIEGRGTWTLPLSEKSQKGNPMGDAKSSKGQAWTGFFFYIGKDDIVQLQLTPDSKEYLTCEFEQAGLKGKTLTGKAYYYADENSDGDEAGSCVATLK